MIYVGEYHRDTVLSLPESQRKQMDLPTWRDDVEIVNEIFGWVLQRGKEKIECRSENEARYIYALWSFGWTDFWVPTDDKYLAEILPRLLKLKAGHDRVLERGISIYSSKKVREELRRRMYLKVTLREKDDEEEPDEKDETLIHEGGEG